MSSTKTIKTIYFAIGLIIAAIIIMLLVNFAFGNNSDNPKLRPPLKTVELNKEYSFPIKDIKGKEITKIKYYIEGIELRDQILVQGKPVSTISGKKFLIFNIKLLNDYDQEIELPTKDYLRLIVSNNPPQAPDIHNDPVTVLPLSKQSTKIGFAINNSDRNLKLQIGEINGQKETLELDKLLNLK